MILAYSKRIRIPSRIFPVLLLLLGTLSLFSQVKPEITPEDVLIGGNEVCYCKPGVRFKSRSKGVKLRYTWLNQGRYKEEGDPLSSPYTRFRNFQHFEIDAKLPLVNKDHFKLLIGYKYFSEVFQFNEIGNDFTPVFNNLDQNRLKSNSFTLIVTKPLNAKKYMAFRFRYSTNGNYNKWISFNKRNGIYKFLGVYGIKPNDDFEWGVGISFAKSFRRFNILPFVVLNKTFNKKWGIESVLPGNIFGRYNISNRAIVLAGAEFGSKSYRLDIPNDSADDFDYAFNHSEILFSVTLEHQFFPWVWGELKTGYQMNLSSSFDSKTDSYEDFEIDPTNQFFLRLGIFVSPHKK
ncbi:MAG: hypothetical protein ACI94Y_003887 [Maribacter sp.]|jgi:hypothetical protein